MEDQPYSLADDEEAPDESPQRCCGGRAFAGERRCVFPIARCLTAALSAVCVYFSANSIAGFCTSFMRGVSAVALGLAALYNAWALWTPFASPWPPSWSWLKAETRARAGRPPSSFACAAMVLFHTVAIAWLSWLCAAAFAYSFVDFDELIEWHCATGKQAFWRWMTGGSGR
mmetsp:Transcript_7676/g.24177  ORF Transcript_7676/g.24177 Transcript_7676/m.24177 type:complete len:172 (-) Transcript_7676:64-579(-)